MWLREALSFTWVPPQCWLGSPMRGGDWGAPSPDQSTPLLRGPSLLTAFSGPGWHMKDSGASPRPGALIWEGASYELILW